MTFTALIYAVVFVLLSLGLVLWYFWPRHEDGSPYSPEEVDEFVSRFPKQTDGGARTALVLVSIVALIAVALSAAKASSPHNNYDD